MGRLTAVTQQTRGKVGFLPPPFPVPRTATSHAEQTPNILPPVERMTWRQLPSLLPTQGSPRPQCRSSTQQRALPAQGARFPLTRGRRERVKGLAALQVSHKCCCENHHCFTHGQSCGAHPPKHRRTHSPRRAKEKPRRPWAAGAGQPGGSPGWDASDLAHLAPNPAAPCLSFLTCTVGAMTTEPSLGDRFWRAQGVPGLEGAGLTLTPTGPGRAPRPSPRRPGGQVSPILTQLRRP